MENRNRQYFKGATAKKNLSEVSDIEIVTCDTGISELFNSRYGKVCHSLSSNSVVKSQSTRLTLRTAWHLPAVCGLVQGVEQLPSPCGQHGAPIPPCLLLAAHGQPHCAGLHLHSPA